MREARAQEKLVRRSTLASRARLDAWLDAHDALPSSRILRSYLLLGLQGAAEFHEITKQHVCFLTKRLFMLIAQHPDGIPPEVLREMPKEEPRRRGPVAKEFNRESLRTLLPSRPRRRADTGRGPFLDLCALHARETHAKKIRVARLTRDLASSGQRLH